MKLSLKRCITVTLVAGSVFFTPLLAPIAQASTPQWVKVVGVGAAVAALYQRQHEDIQFLDGKGRNEMLDEQKKATGVDNSVQDNKQLEQIMERFTKTLEPTEPSLKEKPFNYYVNPEDTFNAFCTLGHNLSVNKGVFDFTNHNTDEIAAVVAHEIAHGIHNHPKEGAYKSMNIKVLETIYAVQNPSYLSLLGTHIVASNLENRGVTKPMEKDADNYSFDYVVNAGYNIGAPAAVWQRIIDKKGEHKQLFIGELFAPSSHPGEAWRRDNFAQKLTAYSGNKVTVNKKDGMIQINKKDFIIPAAVDSMSSEERAYLIAGNLAAVYHNNKVIPQAVQQGQYIYMGKQPIMTVTSKDNAQTILTRLNEIK